MCVCCSHGGFRDRIGISIPNAEKLSSSHLDARSPYQQSSTRIHLIISSMRMEDPPSIPLNGLSVGVESKAAPLVASKRYENYDLYSLLFLFIFHFGN